jgi:hypothetical protein
MRINKSKRGRPSKKRKKNPRRLILPVAELSRRQIQKSLKLLGVTIDCELKFLEHIGNVVSKAKKAVGIIGKLGGEYKDISSQTMRQLYVSCVRPVLEYTSTVWYHRLTGQWKEEMQEIQNTALRKIMEAFKSSPINAMQRDANILLLDVRIEEIRCRFAIRAIRNVSPRNPIRRQTNSDRPSETNLGQLFTKPSR